MLVLHFAFHKCNTGRKYVRDKVTRLNFLSTLFEEVYKYLQDSLCASILGIKIYTMPFCRDFKLDATSIATMKYEINLYRLDGDALVVAPAYRLSLELNTKELQRCGKKDCSVRVLVERSAECAVGFCGTTV